jgi:hypothetical protein
VRGLPLRLHAGLDVDQAVTTNERLGFLHKE